MRARVLQHTFEYTLGNNSHPNSLYKCSLNQRTYIALEGEKREKCTPPCVYVWCVLLFPCVVCLAQRGKWISTPPEWENGAHFSQKETSFFRSQRKKVLRDHSCARARAYIFYTSKALLNAPDENSRTRAVHTHTCVCVFSVFFFTERILFLLLCRIRATEQRWST